MSCASAVRLAYRTLRINGMFWVAVAGALVSAVGLSFAVASRDRWLVAVAVVAIMVAFAGAAV